MTPTTIVLSGGGPAPTTPLPEADLVIAADSGLALADGLRLDVDLIVGDFDSADPELVAEAVRAGAETERHPEAKDATDLELALAAAMERDADRVVVVGGGGGRLDHLLGVATLLCAERWADASIEWHAATGAAYVARGPRSVPTAPGDVVSVLPMSDGVLVTLSGTRWTLDREPLPRGTTRGISNEALEGSAEIDIHHGVALVVVTRSDTT